ncbi:hypothetical protein K2173_021135 [Erythroxylum novogranatense]|uniref:Pectinesterase n=1 Tax=Erythroxylum novogranatense TaxID=1862640 RepID=A0AAV8TQC5_9ROSI|nr:hypothetical protein K2173_021135 [Erythroxylum novogranatense]
MLGKVVASGVSLILVVGVVIGVVAVVNHQNGSNTAKNENMTPQMKMASQLCQPTSYKEACTKTLGSVNSTDPKEFVKAAIMATSDAVKKAFNFSEDIVVQAGKEERTKMALDDCKELLDYAVQELQATFSTVGESSMHTMKDRIDELRSWMSAVLAYQETCVDGFSDKSPIKPVIQQGMIDASHLTDNVLAIMGQMSEFMKSLGLQFNSPGGTTRKLSSADGYPTWMSAADRKLLASGNNAGVTPNAVVAQDGSGQYKTIMEALAAYPKDLKGRYVIYVKAGTYREYVTVAKDQTNVFMYGDGPRQTVVTGDKSFHKSNLGTWKTATFVVEADSFVCKSMGFENTAGPEGHQAVALRVNSDMATFFNCRMEAYQDTLLYQAKRQFYRNCVISGTVDFIFGYGAAVIQNSTLILRRPMDNQQNFLTADGRKEQHSPTGVVIHNCQIVPEDKLVPEKAKIPSYLGRPWKPYSRAIFMESEISDAIHPEGYMKWNETAPIDTLYYGEYANTGPGAATNGRVKWNSIHFLNRDEALKFTAGAFIQGEPWINAAEVPFLAGLKA